MELTNKTTQRLRPVSIRLSDEDYAALRNHANQVDRKASGLIRHLVRAYLVQKEGPGAVHGSEAESTSREAIQGEGLNG